MSINFNHTNGSLNWMHSEKGVVYQQIFANFPCAIKSDDWGFATSYGSEWTRLKGFNKGLYCGILSIIVRIAVVAECVIKGLGNILSAPFSNCCKSKLMTGVNQLRWQLPKNILKLIFFTPFEVVLEVVVTPFAVMVGKEYAEWRSINEQKYISAEISHQSSIYDITNGIEYTHVQDWY